MYMKKVWLFLAIGWSISAPWNAYRVLTGLPQLIAQAYWVTVIMDILWLIFGFVVAIYNWVLFAKSKKKTEDEDEK